MWRVFFTVAAILGERQLFRRIDFVSFRDVVLVFAHGAYQRE